MRYERVVEGRFIRRLNRFVAEVEVDGVLRNVHVKNTGRCRELFIEGVRVFLEPAKNPERKTAYSLVSLYKGEMVVNIDSQIPNKAAMIALKENPHLAKTVGNMTVIKPEVTYGKSRFDLYYENDRGERGFIEVKGVTLEREGIALFPDAPTVRGTKHINELIDSVKEGYRSYILFVVQLSPVEFFTPNQETDPAFVKALMAARREGVGILCYDSIVTPDSIRLNHPVDIHLNN